MSEASCPLCTPDPELVFYRGALVSGLWDAFPASEGRALLVPKRHVPSWLDATREEQAELLSALAIAHEAILAGYPPRGYDIEIHDVPHLHVRPTSSSARVRIARRRRAKRVKRSETTATKASRSTCS